MTILTLASDPTLVATAGAQTQYGTFGGKLYQHATAATDTNWTVVTDLVGQPLGVAALASDPKLAPGVQAKMGQFGTFAGNLYVCLMTVPGPHTNWVCLTWLNGVDAIAGVLAALAAADTELLALAAVNTELQALVAADAELLKLAGMQSGVTYSSGLDVDVSLFAGLGAVAKINVATWAPGAVLVAANAHVGTLFFGGAASNVTAEFSDQANGAASVLKAFDVFTSGQSGEVLGRDKNGRPLETLTCTIRVTGDTAANLVAGSIHVEVLFRRP